VTGEAEGLQQLRFERVYTSTAFATADDLIRQFLTDAQLPISPDCLLLALPGPLHAQHARLTNLDWTLDAADMAATLDIASVRFINDFQAAAAGVATLTAADVVVLNPQPAEPGGVRAITGAGTGLGWPSCWPMPAAATAVLPAKAATSTSRRPMRCRRVCWNACAPPMAMYRGSVWRQDWR